MEGRGESRVLRLSTLVTIMTRQYIVGELSALIGDLYPVSGEQGGRRGVCAAGHSRIVAPRLRGQRESAAMTTWLGRLDGGEARSPVRVVQSVVAFDREVEQ